MATFVGMLIKIIRMDVAGLSLLVLGHRMGSS